MSKCTKCNGTGLVQITCDPFGGDVRQISCLCRCRIVHRAHLVNSNGGVSPLCAKKPRVLDLRRATWTNRDGSVTCPRCLALMRIDRSTSTGG